MSKKLELKFKRTYGVTKEIYDKMLEILEAENVKKYSSGGRPSKVTVENKLQMMLQYYRENRTYLHIGKSYNIAENTCFRCVIWAEEILIKSGYFNLPNAKNIMEDENLTEIIVDATEISIEKPVKSQQKYYSGKKKLHTIKAQLEIDANTGKVLSISTSNGSTHDFKLWKQSSTKIRQNKKILADSGYQGMQKIHKNSVLPFKKNEGKN